MNKKGQAAIGTAVSVAAGNKVVQWIALMLGLVLIGYVIYKISPESAAIMFFIGALLFYVFIFFIFAYFWYWVGKWIYYIVVNAKLFIQKAVSWILAIFE